MKTSQSARCKTLVGFHYCLRRILEFCFSFMIITGTETTKSKMFIEECQKLLKALRGMKMSYGPAA